MSDRQEDYPQYRSCFNDIISSEKSNVNFYNRIAKDGTYESIQGIGNYHGPQLLTDAVSEYIPKDKREEQRVLDVGAGTGLVGAKLRDLGFCHIDAVEPSEEMIALAIERQVYDHIIIDCVSDTKALDIPDASYSIVTANGVFVPGHIPVGGLHELIRLLKPDGLFFNLMRETFIKEDDELMQLEPLMIELENERKWIKLRRDIIPQYYFNISGVLHVYQRL